MCMVLYGYDASVFNSLQGSNNWLAYFDLDPVSSQITWPVDLVPNCDLCLHRIKTHTKSV